MMVGCTTEFLEAVREAITQQEDEIARVIPVFCEVCESPEQREACPGVGGIWGGMWSLSWLGYEGSPVGLIILFEEGVRIQAERLGVSLVEQCRSVLLGLFEHGREYEKLKRVLGT
jgi:hypothetical protein